MTISERMFSIIESKKKRPVDLARHLDLSTGQMTNWKNRNTDPPARYIMEICSFLQVSPEYLLTGEERKSVITVRNKEMLEMYNALPPAAQEFIFDSIRMAYDKEAKRKVSAGRLSS